MATDTARARARDESTLRLMFRARDEGTVRGGSTSRWHRCTMSWHGPVVRARVRANKL